MKVMKKMRSMIKRYERILMLALVVVLLVIFTVTGSIVKALNPSNPGAQAPTAVVGSFEVLPAEKVKVTNAEYQAARGDLQIFAVMRGASSERVRTSEVWTYLLLREAARIQSISVSMQEVLDFLRQVLPGSIYDDLDKYKAWVRARFRLEPIAFEEAIQRVLTSERVREIYADSYRVAPPAARKEMIEQYAKQNLEYARVTYAALDANRFAEAARKAYKALEDPEAKLGEYFAKDPAVQADRTVFRHPRRFILEFLYTIHDRVVSPEAYQRIEDLFKRTYPSLDVTKLEPRLKEMHDFYGYYKDRILVTVGSSYEKLRKELEKEHPKAPSGKEKPAPPPPDLDKTLRERGFELCRDQIDRELRVRKMYQWFRSEARKDETKSLKLLFEKLRKHDDPKNPVCSTEPGKGLIVYREFPQGLAASEIEQLKDGDVVFTHNVRNRVTQMGEEDLPRVGKADTMGEEGNGRMLFRLLEVKKEQRKTFKELTPGERHDLQEKYYLPAQERMLAKQALKKLRARCVAGEVTAKDFPSEARKLGCRVFRDEWITANDAFRAQPDKASYWPAAYLHMRDRYFLRGRLAGTLGADRMNPKLKAGSYLEVQVSPGEVEENDPGAAYLVLLLERRSPGPETTPPSEIYKKLGRARSVRMAEDNDRWAGNIQQLFRDYRMEFYGDMDKRIKEEMRRRKQAAAKAKHRAFG